MIRKLFQAFISARDREITCQLADSTNITQNRLNNYLSGNSQAFSKRNKNIQKNPLGIYSLRPKYSLVGVEKVCKRSSTIVLWK